MARILNGIWTARLTALGLRLPPAAARDLDIGAAAVDNLPAARGGSIGCRFCRADGLRRIMAGRRADRCGSGAVLQRPGGAVRVEGRLSKAETRQRGHRVLLDRRARGRLAP